MRLSLRIPELPIPHQPHGLADLCDPVQVKQRYTGVTLDMGFYSRNRRINPDSSFSVNG